MDDYAEYIVKNSIFGETGEDIVKWLLTILELHTSTQTVQNAMKLLSDLDEV